jgi:hypothetical protein
MIGNSVLVGCKYNLPSTLPIHRCYLMETSGEQNQKRTVLYRAEICLRRNVPWKTVPRKALREAQQGENHQISLRVLYYITFSPSIQYITDSILNHQIHSPVLTSPICFIFAVLSILRDRTFTLLCQGNHTIILIYVFFTQAMKVRYSFLTLLSTVLAEVEFLSINLKGWQNCDNAQMAKISSAWENAVKMAAALRGNINFNEAAAVEYLGPPAYTSDYADEIRQVFENAATFGQGSKWTPTPLKWDAYVRCDDWRRRCGRPGVRAYTTNHMTDPNGKKPASDHERDTSTPVMNLCPSFFKMDTFTEKIAQNKNKEISQKYNLEYYFVNRGLSFV